MKRINGYYIFNNKKLSAYEYTFREALAIFNININISVKQFAELYRLHS